MKICIILYILIIGASCAPMLNNQLLNDWKLFKRVHQKQYATNEEENIRYVTKDFSKIWKNIIVFISMIVEIFGRIISSKFVNIISKQIWLFIPIDWA